MKQMSNIQKGFLFDYKWIPALRDLDPVDFYIVFWQLLDFQQSNGSKKIPRHRGRRDLDHIANLIVPQIENRLNGSLGGHTAHERSASKGGTVPPIVPPTLSPIEGSTVLKISQDKISQVKLSQGELSQGELSQGESPAPEGTRAHDGTHAPERAEIAPHGAAATGGTQKSEKYPRRGTPYTRPYSRGGDQGSTSSFDMDAFFEAAVRKSFGE